MQSRMTVEPDLVWWNLSRTAACGPVIIDLYREVAALQR